MTTEQTKSKKLTFTDILNMFVDGARRGLNIGLTQIMPWVLFAFVIIQILNVTGLLDIISAVFKPVMALWGLPGEAIAVLIASFLSMGGGVGAAMALYQAGRLSAADITVLSPAIFLMGALLQYLGRYLGPSGVPPRYHTHILLIAILNALLSMWIMRLILLFLGVA